MYEGFINEEFETVTYALSSTPSIYIYIYISQIRDRGVQETRASFSQTACRKEIVNMKNVCVGGITVLTL
jgi:hypothetical protein